MGEGPFTSWLLPQPGLSTEKKSAWEKEKAHLSSVKEWMEDRDLSLESLWQTTGPSANVEQKPVFLYAFEDDWVLAYDLEDAYMAVAYDDERLANDYRDDLPVQLDPEEDWSMHFAIENVSGLPEEFLKVAVVEDHEMFGDGWNCEVKAKVKDWCKHFDRGFLASTNY